MDPDLGESINQLNSENKEFCDRVRSFLQSLPIQYWLDNGKLCVAHAGLKEEMIGRQSKTVHHFAIYGDAKGKVDEFGAPIRRAWARAYRGDVTIVYGHARVRKTQWLNNTICLDTGCVFGGRLTALRWPEKEIVDVAAARPYLERRKTRHQRVQ